ncbi:MAG: pilus assembly protein PilP [Desulfobacter sp.]|nr:MAG: pilus assembly protein PilP [Desulfobacter sp.]
MSQKTASHQKTSVQPVKKQVSADAGKPVKIKAPQVEVTGAKAPVSSKPELEKSGLETTSAAKIASPASVQPGAVTEPQMKTELAAVSSSMINSLVIKKYDTKGRVDPFIPLLSEKKEEPAAGKSEEKKPKRILTPLEKMELSQIKLVAVVEMKGRTVAMVEEASGKGYEVEIGTYMGRNEGRVSAITRDGISVKEYVKDFKGNRRERIQEIKFHKDEGGE